MSRAEELAVAWQMHGMAWHGTALWVCVRVLVLSGAI